MAKRVILQVLSFLGIDFAAAIGYTAVGRSQPINPQGSSELPAKNTLGDMRAIVDIN
jgi:hypothetical protein